MGKNNLYRREPDFGRIIKNFKKKFKKTIAKLNKVYYNLIVVEKSGTKWYESGVKFNYVNGRI